MEKISKFVHSLPWVWVIVGSLVSYIAIGSEGKHPVVNAILGFIFFLSVGLALAKPLLPKYKK